jgi:hypothetical protein
VSVLSYLSSICELTSCLAETLSSVLAREISFLDIKTRET